MVKERFELGTANLNYLGKSTKSTLFWTAGDFSNAANVSGYEGLEWHPLTKKTPAGLQVGLGFVGQDFKRSVTSAHQSYRGEKSILEAYKHPNRSLALISYVLLPYTQDSFDYIEHLQNVVRKRLPVVLYPPSNGLEKSGVLRPFGEKTIQLTNDVMKKWNVDDIQGLVDQYQARGYDGFCFDTTHSEYLGGVHMGQNTSALSLLLNHTKEVHIRVGAVDVNLFYKKTDPYADLRSLIDGKNDEPFPKFVRDISNNWQGGRVVVEVQAAAINHVHKERNHDSPLTIRALLDYHRKLVEGLSILLNG